MRNTLQGVKLWKSINSDFMIKAWFPKSSKMKLFKSARFREGEKLGKVTFSKVPVSARWKVEKQALLKSDEFQCFTKIRNAANIFVKAF